MKKRAVTALLILEVCVIIFLFIFIWKKAHSPPFSITPINSKTVKSILAGELLNFYEPAPNIRIEQNQDFLDRPAIQFINNDSLNERFDYPVIKEGGVFRIITIGDSFTYGEYIDTKNNWTELLEDALNEGKKCNKVTKYEVINLGVEGYDLAYEVERYRRRGAKYNPDLIIMLVVEFGRVREYRTQKRGEIIFTREEIETNKKEGRYYPEASILNNQISLLDKINYQKKYFNKFMAIYSNNVLFVDYEKNQEYSSTISTLTKNRENIFVEKTTISPKDRNLLFPDGHPNSEGHKVLMNEIMSFLDKNHLIPCK